MSEKKEIDVKLIIDHYLDGPILNKEECIKEYMEVSGHNKETASNIIDNTFYINYKIANLKQNKYITNSYLLKMIITIALCYYVSFEFISNRNSLIPAIFALFLYSLIALLRYFYRCVKVYSKLDFDLINHYIYGNKLDIDACVNKYLQFNKEANEEEVREKILELFKNNYVIVKNKTPSKSTSTNTVNTIQPTNNGSIFSPNVTKKFACPRCGSTNICLIDDAPGGYKHVSYGPMISHDIDDHFSYGYGYFTTDTKKRKKKVFSKRKAIAAVLTGGASVAFTGLRSKVSSQ